MTTISFFSTNVTSEAIELTSATLRSGFLSEGPLVRRFETELASELGVSRLVALNSGTAALHLGLALCGIGPGAEVILPAQTFVASGLAILMCGATPVFADIDYQTGNISPGAIKEKLTARTAAIMPVHWGGYPCDMDEITAIATAHGFPVIEDAAHALGATYRGHAVGAISRFTAFSFQAIKHLTTGDGGALTCSNDDDEGRARTMRWFGIDRTRSAPTLLGERDYDIETVGYKYHMNDLAAAVGLGNLPAFRSRLERRRSIAQRYTRAFSDVAGLRPLRADPDRESAWWLYTVLADRRDDFIRALKHRGVPASVVHQRINRNAVFGDSRRAHLPNQERFDKEQVALPVHPDLSDEHVETIIAAVHAGW